MIIFSDFLSTVAHKLPHQTPDGSISLNKKFTKKYKRQKHIFPKREKKSMLIGQMF